jgi:hypothetical protein
VEELLHHSPRLCGLVRSRWWLDGLRQVVPWLARCSLGGISQLLRRLDLRYKRGRRHLHSPDLAYDPKLRVIHLARHLAAWQPARYAFLYQDEVTYYRRPAVARAYAARGRDAALAEQGIGPNRRWRIAGCLDVQTGQHIAWQRAHFGRRVLLAYFRQVEATVKATRPDVRRIFVALDNWPVHFHPELLAGLAGTAIRLLPLPTYAPWTNPEEKVWRQLAEEHFYQHPFAATAPPDAGWTDLRQTIQDWLDRHAAAGPALLRLAGLYPT